MYIYIANNQINNLVVFFSQKKTFPISVFWKNCKLEKNIFNARYNTLCLYVEFCTLVIYVKSEHFNISLCKKFMPTMKVARLELIHSVACMFVHVFTYLMYVSESAFENWYLVRIFVNLQKLLESNYISMSMFVMPASACKISNILSLQWKVWEFVYLSEIG